MREKQPLFGIGCSSAVWLIGITSYFVTFEFLGWSLIKISSIALISSFFALWFADFGNWPFDRFSTIKMGFLTGACSLILSWITWHYIDMTDWIAYNKGIPMATTLFFLYLVVSLSFKNRHLKDVPVYKKPFINLVLYFFLAYILIKMGEVAPLPILRGIPFFWLPMAFFYFFSLDSWITDEMVQPSKGIVDVLTVLFLGSALVLGLIHGINVEPLIVHLNPELLAWTGAFSTAAVPLFILMDNHPWDRLKQPLVGIVGLFLMLLVGGIEMMILRSFLELDYLHIMTILFSVLAVQLITSFSFRFERTKN